CRPTAASQDLVGSEPRRRVLFVRVRHESRIGQEVATRPFPDVADHLPATESAVTVRKIRNVHTSHGPPLQIGSPGHPPLPSQRTPAFRNTRGRRLPCLFGRQTSAGPAAVCICFIPVDMNYRSIRLQWNPAIEITPQPASSRFALPVNRMLRPPLFTPAPTAL